MFVVKIEVDDPIMLSHVIYQIDQIHGRILSVEAVIPPPAPPEPQPVSPKRRSTPTEVAPRIRTEWSSEESQILADAMAHHPTLNAFNEVAEDVALKVGRTKGAVLSRRWALLHPEYKDPRNEEG